MDFESAIVRKAAWRILPIIMVCYFAAFLDRVNIGFAALTMNKDLGFTASQFGFGAGIFFLGYVLFELPSNIVLSKVGARRWIARILITWAILSAATAFVWNPASFYVVRILLGAAEAGFFPGIIFFMTLWFPAQYRGRMFATFNIAVPFSTIIGAPLSGYIIEAMNGIGGFSGWQWMFMLEALPALIMGFVVFFYLPETPEKATFLTSDEKTVLMKRLETEKNAREAKEKFTIGSALRDPRVLLMCFIAVGLVMGTTGIAIWMPQFVKEFGLTNMQTGFVTAIPAIFMALSMILVARSADRTGERVWHAAGPFIVSALGFTLAAFA
ncbi:MAG: MFS transporter, partial [Alphaproteobacteria bacterium]